MHANWLYECIIFLLVEVSNWFQQGWSSTHNFMSMVPYLCMVYNFIGIIGVVFYFANNFDFYY